MILRKTHKIGLRMEEDIEEIQNKRSNEFEIWNHQNVENIKSGVIASLNYIKIKNSNKWRGSGEGGISSSELGDMERQTPQSYEGSFPATRLLQSGSISSFGNDDR